MTATPDRAYERDEIPDDSYRDALLTLLAAHSVPVWGWGQRGAYAEMVMDGPSIDHWVRTCNLWAEEERDLWEWESMVAALTDEPADDLVQRVVGNIAGDLVAAITEWADLPFVAACVDGLGEALVHTLTSSTYAPLARHTRVMTLYKRGQFADGCTAIDEIIAKQQLDRAAIESRADKWLDLTRSYATRVAELESSSGWTGHGIATPFDVSSALDGVERRVREHMKER